MFKTDFDLNLTILRFLVRDVIDFLLNIHSESGTWTNSKVGLDEARWLRPQAPDTFGLNNSGQLFIGYHWLAFMNQYRKNH